MLPLGTYGPWTVDLTNGCRGLRDDQGTYISLDTPDMRSVTEWLVEQAEGNVLMTGGGLGVGIDMLKDKMERGRVRLTVLEIDWDIADALNRLYRGVNVIVADANTFKPRNQFRTVWLDHWAMVDAETIEQVRTQTLRYSNGCPDALVSSWFEEAGILWP